MLKSTKIYLFMYYVSLIWSVISCMLSKRDFFFLPHLGKFKSNMELAEGAGHWLQHHSSDKSHILAFSPASHGIISHDLAVCDSECPHGQWERSSGVCGSCGAQRAMPQLCPRLSVGLHGLCRVPGTLRLQRLLESPFPEVAADLNLVFSFPNLVARYNQDPKQPSISWVQITNLFFFSSVFMSIQAHVVLKTLN